MPTAIVCGQADKEGKKMTEKEIEQLTVEEISKTVRPELGADIGLLPWRLIRLIALNKYMGEVAGETAYIFGKQIGSALLVKTPEDLLKTVKDLKIGKAKVAEQTDTNIIIDVTECATCAGIPNIGKPVCQFEAGVISGALEKILNKTVNVTETKCWGLGDKVCRFEVLIL